MKKFILLIFFSVLILGCNNSLEDSSNELVARAGENFLYKNQLPSFKSEEDSLKRFLNIDYRRANIIMKDPNFRSGNFHTGYLNDFEFEGE